MDKNGSFRAHIENAVTAAYKQTGWVLRTFNTREPLPMLTLWKSLIQCRLDYCSQLWSPTEKGTIQTIEKCQRDFLRRITGMKELTYWDQLKQLRLYSQERRRERYMIIYTWRILEGLVPNITSPDGSSSKISAKLHNRRGRECSVPKISKSSPTPIQKLQYASLTIHGQKLFNCLPREIRNTTCCKVETFKAALDRFLKCIPDEPQIPGYTAHRRADSNSLLDMIPHARQQVEAPVNTDGRGCIANVARVP